MARKRPAVVSATRVPVKRPAAAGASVRRPAAAGAPVRRPAAAGAPLKKPAAAKAVAATRSVAKVTATRPAAAQAPGKRPAAARAGPTAKRFKAQAAALAGLPDLKKPPLLWSFTTEADGAYGIFVDETRCMMGDEDGLVCDMDKTSGTPSRTFRLPHGVKCIVGDGDYLYVGTNNGSIYDLGGGRPREVAQIEGFGKLLWIDIRDGLIAASDHKGNVGMLDCEGDVIWKRTDENGRDGWLCRMDRSGVYHGTTTGVKKYDTRGELLWTCKEELDVAYGLQTEGHIWAIGRVDKRRSPEQALALKISKNTGEVEARVQLSGIDSCSLSGDGTRIYDSELHAQPATLDAAWEGAAWKNMKPDCHIFSQESLGDLVFAVGKLLKRRGGRSTAVFECFDFSEASLGNAGRGKIRRTPSQHWSSNNRSDEQAVAEDADDTTTAEGKVIIACVSVGSKVRARVASAGYNPELNCQFPRSLREDGAKFVVDAVELAPGGDFYRCRGVPQRFRG